MRFKLRHCMIILIVIIIFFCIFNECYAARHVIVDSGTITVDGGTIKLNAKKFYKEIGTALSLMWGVICGKVFTDGLRSI